MRGALVGCGYFGQIQLEAWRRIEDVEIIAACDLDLAKAQACASKAYDSVDRMLDEVEVDFLDVATRPESHADLIEIAAKRGLAVICQKPVAPTLEQAVKMAVLAESAGIRVMVHENWRWQPWYREAHKQIQAGAIGHPITYFFRHRQRDGLGPEPYPNQPYFREMPRLLMHETLVHYIDTARFLFGSIEGVYARTRRVNPMIQGEDGAILQIDHTLGAVGTINGNRYLDPEGPGPVMGEALIEGDQSAIRIASNGELYIDRKLAWKPTAEAGYRGDSVHATQQHFVDCLRSGEFFETELVDYIDTVVAVEAAYRSAQSGERVRPSTLVP